MTLTEVSYNLRRLFPFIILGIISILIFFYSLRILFTYLDQKSKETIILNPIFQKIPSPLNTTASSSAGITFKIDTIEGKPVTATASAKVFFMIPPSNTRFGYKEKIFLAAKTMGIDVDTATYRLLGKNAVFADSTQKLVIDIQNFNFTYEYYFENNPSIFAHVISPNPEDAVSRSINFLQAADIYPQELANGKTHTIFFSYDPTSNTIRPVEKNSGANVVEVDFTRPEIDGIPIVSKTFYNSQNYVLMSLLDDGGYKILRSQVKHYNISNEQVGIYPVRTGDEAYKDLQEGNAKVISNPQKNNYVVIHKMFLAYYDSPDYQDYLQPVYVFVGDNDFIAYVPAISKEYLSN